MSISKKRIASVLVLMASLGMTSLWAQTTAPAGSANESIAQINGRDINAAAFNSILMQVAGWRVFRQVFELTLVQGSCSVEGIPINGDEFEKRIKEEYQHTLDTMGVGPDVKNEDRPKILDQLLAQRGVTLIEFRIGLETRAGLRALAKQAKIDPPTEDEIRDLYNARNGKRVAIKIFAIGSNASTAATLRDLINNKKLSPEVAAAGAGIGQPQSLTIPENAKVPDIEDIKKVAFMTRENQLSDPLDHNKELIMIYVDKIYPESPTKFENIKPADKAELSNLVQTFKENQWMEKRLNQLRANAVVDIKDPYLLQQYKAIAAQVQNQIVPTSQPAIPGIPDAGTTTLPNASAATKPANRP